MKTVSRCSYKHIIHNGLKFSEVLELFSEFVTPKGYSFVKAEIIPGKVSFSVVFIFKSNYETSF